jgi:hypothetical protein
MEELKIVEKKKYTELKLLYEKLRKYHNCITCLLSENGSYLNWCGNDICIYKKNSRELNLIKKILDGEPLVFADVADVEWCKISIEEDYAKGQIYIEKVKKLLHDNGHICFKLYRECDCCNGFDINWCRNPDKCLLKESIDKRNNDNKILLEKIKEHNCVSIIESTPNVIKWCGGEDVCVNADD